MSATGCRLDWLGLIFYDIRQASAHLIIYEMSSIYRISASVCRTHAYSIVGSSAVSWKETIDHDWLISLRTTYNNVSRLIVNRPHYYDECRTSYDYVHIV